MRIDCLHTLDAVSAEHWNALDGTRNPFLRHQFLSALENSRSVGPGSGWLPRHVVLRDDGGRLAGAMPLYAKEHSYGEYVFDWAWADAYARNGLRYYPKLVNAVPFSPVNGPRLLNGGQERLNPLLLAAALEQTGFSSWHSLFCTSAERDFFSRQGLLIREGVQFHWRNAGYRDFEDFLSAFVSRKRKQVKKERRDAQAPGLTLECRQGSEIASHHWDALYGFYLDTVHKKGAIPYLTRDFFHRLGDGMADACVLFLAKLQGRYVAGAFNLRGPDALYGRYWGALGDFPGLHFELCYYQGIEYCIREGLSLYESGAQGEHKLARGFLPSVTYSAHWIADARFRAAIADFLMRESAVLECDRAALMNAAPFRTASPCQAS